jgi:hypothetical protein
MYNLFDISKQILKTRTNYTKQKQNKKTKEKINQKNAKHSSNTLETQTF